MSITTDLNDDWNQDQQLDDEFEARALLQNFRNVMNETHTSLDEIKDSGNFDLLKASIKSALNNAWTYLKTCQTGFEDADIVEVLDWKPPS
jgi:hypothetical protein